MSNIKKLLNPLELSGGISVSRIMPGPLEGLMRPLFYRVFNELELTTLWITPFLRITTHVPGNKKMRDFLEPLSGDIPVIAQLLGSHPDCIAASAGRLRDFGIAGINLNFACPSTRVLRKNGGGALLKDLPLMLEIINRVKTACPDFSVSVKLRCGFDSPDEMDKIIPALAGTDIDFIALHFRTVREMYRKTENGLERLARAVELAATVPIIGNGDIYTPEDAEKMMDKTGCEGVMTGRGILQNPRLIRDIESRARGETPPGQDARTEFFTKLLGYAAAEPGSRRRRSSFIEYARFAFGSHDPRFEAAKNLTEEQLTAGKWLFTN